MEEKPGFGAAEEMDSVGTPQNSTSPTEAPHADTQPKPNNEASLQSKRILVKSLSHSAQCRDDSCPAPRCNKMKRVLRHTKSCQSRNSCHICKQTFILCCLHAKQCTETRLCTVPFCQPVKRKLRQKNKELRLQHERQRGKPSAE